MSVNISFMYLGIPTLGAYIFTSVIYSWIDLFIIIKVPICLLLQFMLKSILFNINIATPAIFLLSFSWNTGNLW